MFYMIKEFFSSLKIDPKTYTSRVELKQDTNYRALYYNGTLVLAGALIVLAGIIAVLNQMDGGFSYLIVTILSVLIAMATIIFSGQAKISKNASILFIVGGAMIIVDRLFLVNLSIPVLNLIVNLLAWVIIVVAMYFGIQNTIKARLQYNQEH